jgi:hypothetical protein
MKGEYETIKNLNCPGVDVIPDWDKDSITMKDDYIAYKAKDPCKSAIEEYDKLDDKDEIN